MPLASGVRLGPYEMIALLGSGGMGEVYRAKEHVTFLLNFSDELKRRVGR